MLNSAASSPVKMMANSTKVMITDVVGIADTAALAGIKPSISHG